MIGETIHQYKITSHLGTGGMGEVYLAVDSKLDREVALKFLPKEMAANGDVKARFLQEARAASALNHPNICTIHDIQNHDGQMFIVMEHIDGETLREKKDRLSLNQVLEIGAQIADGLGAAHAKGIVHRDIKTENIMVRKDNIVQIMDFGLAKLRGVSRLTKEGSTLGTVGYMSPEQAQGLDVDNRSDIFSLGVVLFEMLTGELPFRGAHEAAIMYEIVNVDSPPPSALKPEIDPELDRIVLECLQKEPDERYQSAKEIAKDLRRFKRDSGRKRVSRISQVRPSKSLIAAPSQTAPHETVETRALSTRRGETIWRTVAAVAIVIAIASLAWKFTSPGPARQVVRATIVPPPATTYYSPTGGHIALSPDGRYLAFVGVDSSSGGRHLVVRALSSSAALPLPGTEGALYPFWSADSRYVGYFAHGKLMKILATGGPAQTICEAPVGRGGTWNSDGVIVFAPEQRHSFLHRVSAAGGESVPVTVFDSTNDDYTHRWPWFLPDGKHFLFFARTEGDNGGENDAICLGSLDGGIAERLIRTKSDVAYADGHILYMLNGTLMAHPFDPSSLEFTGDAVPIAENVSMSERFSRAVFTVSQTGALVYQEGHVVVGSQLTVFDRNGRMLDTIGDRNTMYVPKLSPDESRLAVEIQEPDGQNIDIWIYDLRRGIRTRLTFDSSRSFVPTWSPDGQTVAFSSDRNNQWGFYSKDVSGTRPAKLLLTVPENSWMTSWSHDGRFISYLVKDSSGADDIGILAVGRDSVINRFTETSFDEESPIFSHDGRWLAYSSNESGERQVYVVPFPDPTDKWQISVAGGSNPRWRGDDKEIYYYDNTDHVVAVEVDGSGETFKIGDVHSLFAVRGYRIGTVYAPWSDGQRFVVNLLEGPRQHMALSLVLNWPEEVKKP